MGLSPEFESVYINQGKFLVMSTQENHFMRVEQVRKDWADAALEVTKSATSLDMARQSYKDEKFTPVELSFLDAPKKEEANITGDLVSPGGTFGASGVIMEALIDLFDTGKKPASGRSKEEGDEEIAFTPGGTSEANKKEARSLGKQAPTLFQKIEEKQKQSKEPESVFKGLMDNPDAERLRKENLARQRALALAQKHEFERMMERQSALTKQATNTRTQNNLAQAKRQHMEKLARLGLIPSLEPKSPYSIN